MTEEEKAQAEAQAQAQGSAKQTVPTLKTEVDEYTTMNGRGKKVVKPEYAPKEQQISGELLSVSGSITSNGRTFRMVSIDGYDPFPINEQFFKRNAELLQEGKYLSITFQLTVAGKTRYVGSTGECLAHSSTGRAVTTITPTTRVEALARFGALIPEEASASRQSALATMFAGAVSKV